MKCLINGFIDCFEEKSSPFSEEPKRIKPIWMGMISFLRCVLLHPSILVAFLGGFFL